MKKVSQNANPSIAISVMFNKNIIRSNTTWTLMNILGMDYPDQVANNHSAEPTYIQTVDALLYCQNKRTMCTARIKLTVTMDLFCCPPTGIISQRTGLYDCVHTWVALGTPASLWTAMHGARHWIPKMKYWMYITMQATTTASQVGMQAIWLGYRTYSLLRLSTNHSRFPVLLAQSTTSSLVHSAPTHSSPVSPLLLPHALL